MCDCSILLTACDVVVTLQSVPRAVHHRHYRGNGMSIYCFQCIMGIEGYIAYICVWISYLYCVPDKGQGGGMSVCVRVSVCVCKPGEYSP